MSAPTIGVKIGYAITSAIMSVGIWVAVIQDDPSSSTTFSIPNVDLIVRNKPDDLALMAIASKVRLSVKTSKDIFDRLDLSSVKAFAELQGAKEGRGKYTLAVEGLPRSVKVLSQVVGVELERMVRKETPVRIDPVGSLPASTKLLFAGALAQPESISLEGPKSLVADVASVRGLLDLSKVTPNGSYSISVEALDASGKPVPKVNCEPKRVMVHPSLSPAPEQRPLLVVPAFVGQPAAGFKVAHVDVQPNQVLVRGPSSLLASLSTIDTSPISLKDVSRSTSFRVRLKLPDKAKADRDGYVTVRVTIIATEIAGPPASGPGR